MLEASGAAECREEIKKLQQAIKQSQQRIAAYREQMISARPQDSLSLPESLWTKSIDDLKRSIAAEERTIDDFGRQIRGLKERFRSQLREIGIEAFDDEIEGLLMPVTQDDFVSRIHARLTGLIGRLQCWRFDVRKMVRPTMFTRVSLEGPFAVAIADYSFGFLPRTANPPR